MWVRGHYARFSFVIMKCAEPVSTAELALLIAMIAVFVAALILVSRYDRTDGGR